MKLRNQLVRLAYEKPELRKDLLPLLKAPKTAAIGKKEFLPMLSPGDNFISEKNKYKYHMFTNSLNVIDLQDAGRRGKVVTIHILTLAGEYGELMDETAVNLYEKFESALQMQEIYISEVEKTMQMLSKYEGFGYQKRTEKAVRHTPVTTKPIIFTTKPRGKVEISWAVRTNDFLIKYTNNPNIDGEQKVIFTGKGKDAMILYVWLANNIEKAKRMDFKDIRKVLKDYQIKFKVYYPS